MLPILRCYRQSSSPKLTDSTSWCPPRSLSYWWSYGSEYSPLYSPDNYSLHYTNCMILLPPNVSLYPRTQKKNFSGPFTPCKPEITSIPIKN